MLINVDFEKKEESVKLPEIAYNDKQAGIDFYLSEDLLIRAKDSAKADLKVSWNPKFKGIFKWFLSKYFKIYMQIKSKSGLAFKKGLEITNAGVIDEDYSGNIQVLIYNESDSDVVLNKDDKVCQGIVHILPKLNINGKYIDTKHYRGNNGFGSSN